MVHFFSWKGAKNKPCWNIKAESHKDQACFLKLKHNRLLAIISDKFRGKDVFSLSFFSICSLRKMSEVILTFD